MRDCIVCNEAVHASHYCLIDGQDYVRCRQCGLVYVDHLLPAEQLYRAYSGDVLKSLRRKLMAPFRKLHHYGNFSSGMQRARQIIDFTGRQLGTAGGRLEYMDIGCNRGYLLAVAHEQGWNPQGVELVPELMAPFLNSYPQYRQQVFSERFEDVRKKHLKDNSLDVITGLDVVEHFEDVVADLAGIYAVLKPGGVVVLQTPDAGCAQAQREGCEWGALKPLEHLHLFDGQNFEIIARRVGFSDYSLHEAFEEADGNFVAVLRKSA